MEGAGSTPVKQTGRQREVSDFRSATTDEAKVVDRARSAWWLDILALIFFGAFALLLCRPILSGKVPVASDTLALWPPWSQLQHEPIPNSAIADSVYLYLSWNTFERDAIADGEWPFWDPYSFSGASFAANSQNQLYYPMTWLLWMVPLSLSIQLLTIFNIWLAGAGMYLLCRHFGVGRAGALVAGLGFSGSGMLQLATEIPGVSTPYGWLPWMLLAVGIASSRRTALWTAFAALVCGLQLVSGNLQWAIYSYFAVGCWLAWKFIATWAREGPRNALRTLVPPLLALAGGVALAAVHLAPLLELSGLSSRGTARVSSHSASLTTLLRLLMPEYFGPLSGGVGTPVVFNDLWYVGIGLLLFALLGLGLSRRPERWLWFGMALFAVAVAYGIGPFLFVRRLPGLSSLVPARIGYLFIFSVCLLAAFGLDAWQKVCRESPLRAARALTLAGLVLAIPLGAATVVGATGTTSPSLASLRQQQMLRALLLVVAVVGLCSLLLWRRIAADRPKVLGTGPQELAFSLGVALLLIADLATVAPMYNTYVSPDALAPSTPSVDWLRAHARDGRVMALGVDDQPPTLVPNVQMLYALQSVSGYDSLHTARYEEYWGAIDPSVQPSRPGTPYSNVFVRPQVYS